VYGGLSVGPHFYPDEIQPSCGGGTFGVGEARLGAAKGLLALEVRGTAVLAYATTSCALEPIADVAPPFDGIHTRRDYGFSRKDAEASLDARLRFGGTRELPLVVALGGGRLTGPGITYGVASVGFRSRGRTRIAVDLEANLYHLPFDAVEVEIQGGHLVRSTPLGSGTEWSSGAGLRLGVERQLF
jgi:hypothetical protein